MSHIHVRVKDDKKRKVQKVLDALGLDMSSAITLYLNQIIITQGIPFPLVTENGLSFQKEQEILQAEKEAEQGVNVVRTNNWKESKSYLDSLKG